MEHSVIKVYTASVIDIEDGRPIVNVVISWAVGILGVRRLVAESR